MKTHKPLPLPNNSAWDRKTWRSYSPVWFLEFVRGIQNLIHWLPVIWKDRHWDDHYIFEVLKHKIKLQQKYPDIFVCGDKNGDILAGVFGLNKFIEDYL